MRSSVLALATAVALVPLCSLCPFPSRALVRAETPSAHHVKVSIDRSKVDLAGHVLQASMSRPADRVHLKVLGDSGGVLAELDIPFHGAPAGTPLVCRWTPTSDEAAARVEVTGYATDGYWAGIAIVPWKAEVPHEEVTFATDSDAIAPGEVAKLEASRAAIALIAGKHADLGEVRLYIVGHTDSVGTTEHNAALSRRRAQAIGAWFRQHGVRMPIAYEGFGEAAPRVVTGDEVDEPKNRRVDYVISAEPLPLPSPALAWHPL